MAGFLFHVHQPRSTMASAYVPISTVDATDDDAATATTTLGDIVMPRHLSYSRLNRHRRTTPDDDDDQSEESDWNDAEQQSTKHELEIGNYDDVTTLETSTNKSLFTRYRKFWKKLCIGVVATHVIVFLILAMGGSAGVKVANRFRGRGHNTITFEDVMSGTFTPSHERIDWLREAGDGVHSEIDSHGIKLIDIAANTTKYLIKHGDIRGPDGHPVPWQDFRVSSDMRYILVNTDVVKVWRHSTLSNFWIHDTQTGTTRVASEPGMPPSTSFMMWSPTGHALAYVAAHDVFILPSPDTSPIRITNDGNATLFNGVCDWVYEEEMFSQAEAMWWSPDATRLAFLSFEESGVPEYGFPIFNTDREAGHESPYTHEVMMRYPKPGFPNPRVTIQLFDLNIWKEKTSTSSSDDGAIREATSILVFDEPFTANDRVVTEVAWVSSHDLMITQSNRISTRQKTAHFDLVNSKRWPTGVIKGKVVRNVDYNKLDGGWFEPSQSIMSLDPSVHLQSGQTLTKTYPQGYLDILPDSKGFRHIAYFSPFDASQPTFLTGGNWEVDGKIQGIDLHKGLIFFVAANPSTERHIYSVSLPQLLLPTTTIQPTIEDLTNSTSPSWYSTSFSPFATYYVLQYEGPNVPKQTMVKVGDSSFGYVLEDNEKLTNRLARFAKNKVSVSKLKSVDGQDMNLLEIRPANMDLSGRTKYPVLLRVYGGPGSQMVHNKFDIDWHHYLVSSLKYLVIMIDGRGTGWQGRKFRSAIHNQLGQLETEDVIEGARQYSENPWVDKKRVGIWGWSFGGYLTLKTIEANSSVFSLGMAVAPVSDWAFYDSLYTERYMSTPQDNPLGYSKSKVENMQGFHNTDLALAHGSGDDNVHFLHSATLLDRFTQAQVRRFRFRMFTDSNHGIYTRGAYQELHQWLTEFLVDKWGRHKTIHIDD